MDLVNILILSLIFGCCQLAGAWHLVYSNNHAIDNANNHLAEFSFDYSISSPNDSYWNFSSPLLNASNQSLITATQPVAGIISNLKLNTPAEWSLMLKLNLNASASSLTKFGLLFHSTSQKPNVNSNTSISNFRGLGVWLNVAQNGGLKAFWSSSFLNNWIIDNETTMAPIVISTCGDCHFNGTVPQQLDIAIHCFSGELTIAWLAAGEAFPKACISRAILQDYMTLRTTDSFSLMLLALPDTTKPYSQVGVRSLNFYELKTGNPWSTTGILAFPNDDINYTYYLDGLNSFGFCWQGTVFQNHYEIQGPAYRNIAEGNPYQIDLLPALPNAEGRINSLAPIAPGTTRFRAELVFRTSSFYPPSEASSLCLFFGPKDAEVTAEKFSNSANVSAFEGLMFCLELGHATGKGSLFFSANQTSNYALSNTNAITPCPGTFNGSDMNQDTWLILQAYESKITVSLAPPLFKGPQLLFSNYYLPGLNDFLSRGNASIGIMQYNKNINITVSVKGFFLWTEMQQPVAVPTPPTTSQTLEETEISSQTGFPIPDLIEGNAVPRVSLDSLLRCPFIQPSIRAPDENNSTKIYFSLTIDRLLEIRDIDEVISISATMYLQWGVKTCDAAYTANDVEDKERVIVVDAEKVWHPTIIFANSSDDVYMQATQYGSDMQVLYVPTTPFRTLYFYWTRIGIFTSKCELDLRKFPFDEQSCDFSFLMKEPNNFLSIGGVRLVEPTMSPNGQWILRHSDKGTGETPSTIVKNGASSFATFQLSFQRNPSYHIYNLLAPCYVLIALVLASFLMPPEKPDRPVICCTILLAFVVAQSDVLKEVPHTSQRILLAEYILMFTGLTGVVTMYDMINCGYSHSKASGNKMMNLLGSRFRCRIVRGLDVAAFLFALMLFLLINLYAAVVIID